MKFFLLLSCLTLSAATATTPKEFLLEAFNLLLSGQHEAYAKLYSDGAVVDIDFGPIDTSIKGVHIVGQDLDIPTFLERFAKLTIYDIKYEVYNHESDPLLGHYNGHFLLKDESGQRWSIDFICEFGITDNGLLDFATHRPYSVRKIDAGSLSIALLEGFKKANVDVLTNNLAPEFCMTAVQGPSHQSYNTGKLCGIAGVHTALAAQGAAFETFTIEDYKLVSLTNDGKSAIFSLYAFIEFKTGKQVFDLYHLDYHVNDKGQFTWHSGTTVSSYEITAAQSDKEL